MNNEVLTQEIPADITLPGNKRNTINYEELDQTGCYLVTQRPKIESIEPTGGKAGDIITIRGSGFSKHIRNNCVVVGGMGACARVQPGATDTEIKVKIDPIPKKSSGEVLMWTGSGSNFYNEDLNSRSANLSFSETAIFRNGSPVAAAGVEFSLIEPTKNAFGGQLVSNSTHSAELGGHELDNALRVTFPQCLDVNNFSSVDICLILKEHPTLAIDFTANIKCKSLEHLLRSLARTIIVNGNHIGERLFADVVSNKEDNSLELYVTKPYLEKGLLTIHFD